MECFRVNDVRNYMAPPSLFVLLSVLAINIAASDLQEGQDAYSGRLGQVDMRVKHIEGAVVTGENSVLGRPVFDWGEPFGPFNFPTTFAYNEMGESPFQLDETTPDSAVLATGVSPIFLGIRGVTPDDVEPAWVNVPLRKVPVNTDFAFVERQALRGVLDAEPLELAQAEPAGDITLGEWMEARGDAKISCLGNESAVNLRLRNLIPNRMYSVWATMKLPQSDSGSGPAIFPLPLGGTPNLFITDKYGNATYKRVVKFCPYEVLPTGGSMLNISVQYHANHQNYGAVPTAGAVMGNWIGLIQFAHVQFPVNVERLRH